MGFFTVKLLPHKGGEDVVAIPFRVGWGFSLEVEDEAKDRVSIESQSLSGWDGVFH